jgi:DNA-directed RNA polymerase subunit RPC12/RpoP
MAINRIRVKITNSYCARCAAQIEDHINTDGQYRTFVCPNCGIVKPRDRFWL